MINQWQDLIIRTTCVVAVLTCLVLELLLIVSMAISYCFSEIHVEQSLVLYWGRQIALVQLLRHCCLETTTSEITYRAQLHLIKQILNHIQVSTYQHPRL